MDANPPTALGSRTYRFALIALAVLVVGVSVKYAVKASEIRAIGTKQNLEQSRSAFLRWRNQIRQLDDRVNIYQAHNYPNPPVMALILWPFAHLPPLTGAMTWFYAKVAMTVLALVWVFRMVEGSGTGKGFIVSRPPPFPPAAKLLTVLLALPPLLGDLTHGNVNLLILFLVVAALYAFHRGYGLLSGATLALAIACKVTPALFLFYFAWKRSWRVLAGCAAGLGLFLAVVPGLALGWAWNLELLQSWYGVMVKPFVIDGVVTSEHPNQSLPGVVYRLLTANPSFIDYVNDLPVPAEYHNLTDVGTGTARWLVKGFMAAFALAVVGLCRRSATGWRLAAEFSLIVLGMLLFSERTWKHHAVTLVLPFAVLTYYLFVERPTGRRRAWLIGALAAATLLNAGAGLLGERGRDLAQVYGAHALAYLLLTAAVASVLAWSGNEGTGAVRQSWPVRRGPMAAALLLAAFAAGQAYARAGEVPPVAAKPSLTRFLLDSPETPLAVAVLLAPLPLALALRRRDVAGNVITAVLVLVLTQAAVFAGVAVSGHWSRPTLWAAETVVAVGGTGLLLARLRRDPGGGLPKAAAAYLGVAALLAAGGLLSVRCGQPYDWDLRSYHYYNAHAFLTGRLDRDFAAAGRESFFNPLPDVPAYLLANHLRPAWAGFALGAAHLLPVALLFALADRALRAAGMAGRWRRPGAVLCAAAGACEPAGLAELGTSFHDNVLAGFVLGSLLLVVRALTTAGRPRAVLLAAGMLLGAGAGLKPTLAVFAVAAVVALPWAAPTVRRGLGYATAFGAGALAGFLAVDGWWLLTVYDKFGNPVLPWLNAAFGSPYWEGPAPPVTKLPVPHGWLERLAQPFTLVEFRRNAMEVPVRDFRPAATAVLLAALAVAALRRGVGKAAPVLRFLAVFTVAAFVVWQRHLHILRYLAPVLMLAPLVSLLALDRLFARRTGAALAAGLALGFALVGGTKVGDYGRKAWADDYFEVDRSRLAVAPGSVVFISAKSDTFENPFTHLATFLPGDSRVVNLDADFLRPGLAMRHDVEELVRGHRGPVYLLAHRGGWEDAARRLLDYGLFVSVTRQTAVAAPEFDLVLAEVCRGRIEYPASELPGLTGRAAGGARTAEAPDDPSGFIAFGPYQPLRPGGRYVASIRLDSSGDPTWDVAVDQQALVAGPPGGRVVFTVPAGSQGRTEVRAFFPGRGRLTVGWVAIEAADALP